MSLATRRTPSRARRRRACRESAARRIRPTSCRSSGSTGTHRTRPRAPKQVRPSRFRPSTTSRRRMSYSSRISSMSSSPLRSASDRRILRRRRRAHDRVLVQLRHRGDQLLRADRIAHAPAGHRVRLRKTVDDDRALLHAVDRGDRDVRRAAVGQLAVDLIGQDDQVVLLHDLRDRLQIRAAHDGAGRVVRVQEDEGLRLFRDRAFQLLGRQAEFVFHLWC